MVTMWPLLLSSWSSVADLIDGWGPAIKTICCCQIRPDKHGPNCWRAGKVCLQGSFCHFLPTVLHTWILLAFNKSRGLKVRLPTVHSGIQAYWEFTNDCIFKPNLTLCLFTPHSIYECVFSPYCCSIYDVTKIKAQYISHENTTRVNLISCPC